MSVKAPTSSRKIIISSLVGDVVDIVLNTSVALITGSVVMIVEALQGMANLITDALLLVGLQRANHRSDVQHPFGYGKETYFWTLIATFLMLAITASFSIYLGWLQVVFHEQISVLWLAYAVLIIAIATNSYSMLLSFRRLAAKQGRQTIWKILVDSPFVATKMTFILDVIGVGSATIGLISLLFSDYMNTSLFDGIGAVLIGGLIALSAIVLLGGLRGFIIGKSAGLTLRKKITAIVEANAEIHQVLDLKTMLMGPEHLLVNLEIHAKNSMTTSQLEKIIDRIKNQLQAQIPMISHVQVELETPTDDEKETSKKQSHGTKKK